jgi:hypothetical protein
VSGKSNDRMRALNVPQRVKVELDAAGLPKTVGDITVEAVLETWRIDDEWWRRHITRRYHEIVLDGGKHVVLFEDQTSTEWWIQTP